MAAILISNMVPKIAIVLPISPVLSWMERKTNIWIIENIKPEWTLESRVPKAALSYFWHVVRAGGMEDDVMLGKMIGASKRGRPRQRWLDTQGVFVRSHHRQRETRRQR